MSPRLCSLLLALQALMTAATSTSKTCSSGGEKEIQVDGWPHSPVQIALRVPVMADITVNISLMSHDHKAHTHLTLTHKSQQRGKIGQVGMTTATLTSEAATSALHLAALLPDAAWETLTISARHKELVLKINSETSSSIRYSSRGSLAITRHLHVSKVGCSSPSCTSYIDLKCRNGMHNHTKEHNKTVPQESSPNRGVFYYWGFYVVIALIVMACLLFLVWRHEKNKFKNRWMIHSQTVRRMASTSDDAENPNHSVQHLTRGVVGHNNPAYDETGDADN